MPKDEKKPQAPAVTIQYEADRDTVLFKQHSENGLTVVGGVEVRMPANAFLSAASQILSSRLEAERQALANAMAQQAAATRPKLSKA